MMTTGRLRLWHRTAALILAPFLLLQVFSGLVLNYGRDGGIPSLLEKKAPPPVEGTWTPLMAKLHLGPGLIGDLYHTILVAMIVLVVGSGLWLWFDLHRLRSEGE